MLTAIKHKAVPALGCLLIAVAMAECGPYKDEIETIAGTRIELANTSLDVETVEPLTMPFGWIRDMDFGKEVISEELSNPSPYSLVYFGGRIIDGGYDPRLYILRADVPGEALDEFVDKELGRVLARYPQTKVVGRVAAPMLGGPAEWIEMSRVGMGHRLTVRTFQVHLIRNNQRWILKCVSTEGYPYIEIMKPNLPRFEMALCKDSLFSVHFP